MANLAPLLLLGGAAIVVASASRKKKKRKPSGVVTEEGPIIALPPQKIPKVVSNWKQRQEALAFLGDHGVCDCDPGGIDGKYGGATKSAVMEFQRYAGLDPDGKWGSLTEKAMLMTLRKLDKEGVPAPKPKPSPLPSDKQWTPDDIIVMDADCKYMLHISDDLFKIQTRRAIEYALEGDTTHKDAESINQEMVEEYAPLCASLGRDGVGDGVRQWWDVNTNWIYKVLRGYELLPETLDEDAESYGLS